MSNIIKTLTLIIGFLAISQASTAQTHVQQLALEGHDGDRITGFIYQHANTKKDAPIALLMHGLMGSSLHWLAEGNMSYGDDLTDMLISKGYRVLALDARAHGARKKGQKPYERVKGARAGNPEAYIEMIENTVQDYNTVLERMLTRNFKETSHVLAVGYSMGAQMGVLLSAKNDKVTHLVTMVPPAVKNVPAVSPGNFADKVSVPWLLITASDDQFSKPEDNQHLVDVAGKSLTNIELKSGHALPKKYLAEVANWVEAIAP